MRKPLVLLIIEAQATVERMSNEASRKRVLLFAAIETLSGLKRKAAAAMKRKEKLRRATRGAIKARLLLMKQAAG